MRFNNLKRGKMQIQPVSFQGNNPKGAARNIAQVTVPQTNHKHAYAIDFKMACMLTRKYFALWSKLDYQNILVEMLLYINPVRPNRADKRNLKTKPAVWFVYRVA